MTWIQSAPQEGGSAVSPLVWNVEAQFLLNGDLEVRLWVTISSKSRKAQKIWNVVLIPSNKIEDSIVQATIAHIESAVENGDHAAATDLMALLQTL